MSRRAFLAGGVAAVAVGGAGAFAATHRSQVRRTLHDAGVVTGPDPTIPPTAATFEDASFASAAAGRDVGYAISMPSGPPDAIVYCLHGRGGNHLDAFDHIGVHHSAADAGLSWVVASVDGGESYWHRRRDGSDTQRMLLEEFMPMVAARVPSPVPSFVLGWSMGGYGALLLAEQHADRFAGFVVASPALWHSFGASAPGAFDDVTDFTRNDVFAGASALAAVPVRVDCPEDDPFIATGKDLLRRVPSIEGSIRPGFHDDGTWRSFLPDELTFLRRLVE